MPDRGSSGSISPISIFVRSVLASRSKISSTFSPLSAETSRATDMPFCDAHVLASLAETSLPSVDIVAVFAEPRFQLDDFGRVDSEDVSAVLTEAFDASISSRDGTSCIPPSSARSALLPARIVISCGEARAFASCKNVGRPANEALDATSYTSIAPAAPR